MAPSAGNCMKASACNYWAWLTVPRIQDMLWLCYPDAREEDLPHMEQVARELDGEKLVGGAHDDFLRPSTSVESAIHYSCAP